LYELTKACLRSKKYLRRGGGILGKSCQNRRVIFVILHNGLDSTPDFAAGKVVAGQ
jgi:hypothetical protein